MTKQDIAATGAPPESLLRSIDDCDGFGILVTDQQGNIVHANPRFCEASGCSLENIKGRTSRVFQSCQAEPAGNPARRPHATTDDLAGLPNQDALIASLSEVLSRSQNDGSGFSLFHLSVDNFRCVSDTVGPTGIDHLLKEIATRISSGIRANDLIARCGPSQFGVILKGTIDKNICAETARRILQRIALPTSINGLSVAITGTIGIVRYPLDAGNADDLLRAATLLRGKETEKGGNCFQFFLPEIDHPAPSIEVTKTIP
jgi:diguanylate cyclase (GGDEF)-like protein